MSQEASTSIDVAKLKKIAEHWHHLAECKFASATNYPKNSFGERFIVHGAICYRNCAWELEREIARLEECYLPANSSQTQK